VFIAMRYWHPMTAETARRVREWRPDRVVLLPLYPQYSTSTTASSIKAWKAAGVNAPTYEIEGYATEPGFVAALARRTRDALAQARFRQSGRMFLDERIGREEIQLHAGQRFLQCAVSFANIEIPRAHCQTPRVVHRAACSEKLYVQTVRLTGSIF